GQRIGAAGPHPAQHRPGVGADAAGRDPAGGRALLAAAPGVLRPAFPNPSGVAAKHGSAAAKIRRFGNDRTELLRPYGVAEADDTRFRTCDYRAGWLIGTTGDGRAPC